MSKFLKWLFFIAFYFLAGYSLYAQDIMITGKITDKITDAPLSNVLVTIRPADSNKIIKFAQSSSEGEYQIKLPNFPENHVLHFSMMGYAPQTSTILKGKLKYNVQLTEKSTQLKEVIVKAPGIHEKGDTITYMVSAFSNAQDRSLADVLKKMPGIEVDKTGEIKYNGMTINKFYIEGKDLLGVRYELATNNIHQKDVGSVVVMENHQPVKALEDISFSRNPAINIRLKEDAKARWVGTAKIGAGVEPFLWNSELFLMRFTSKTQSLNTYKTNNTGSDITQETQSFTFDDVMSQFSKKYDLKNYINVRPDKLTDLDANRVRFNKSHLVSTNNLWALSKEVDLTSQISYTSNRLNSDNITQTSYYLKDSIIINDIAESSLSKQNHLTADVVLAANTSKYYIKNKINADIFWDDINMSMTGSFPNNQSASVPHRQVSNDLDILKRSGNKIYTLNSYNFYQVKPQELTIAREDEKQHQSINSTAYFTNTSTSMVYHLKPVNISMKMGIIGVIRSMKSELTGVSDTLGPLSNKLSMQYMNFYVSPEIEYKNSGFEAILDLPVSYAPYNYHNKLTKNKESNFNFFLSPKLFMRYHFTSRLSASVTGSISQNAVEEQQFYEGLLLQNYRNLSRGLINYEAGNQKSISFFLSYKKPLKSLFANISIMRTWDDTKQISERLFLDKFILNTYIPQNNSSDLWTMNSTISKGIDFINGLVSLRSSYITVNSAIFQNKIKTPFSSEMWSITSKINSNISKWCNLNYEITCGGERIKLKDTGIKSVTTSFSQTLNLNITSGDKWYIQLVGEHYYNKMASSFSKHLLLTDAEFTYSLGKGWEINLSVKNIFNEKEYKYTMFDGLTSMNKEYKIRGRNFLASIFFRF